MVPDTFFTLFYRQSKQKDAKAVAYLSFYTTPKNKIDAFLVGVSHSYLVSLFSQYFPPTKQEKFNIFELLHLLGQS